MQFSEMIAANNFISTTSIEYHQLNISCMIQDYSILSVTDVMISEFHIEIMIFAHNRTESK